MLRCFHLLEQLAREHEVHVVTPQPEPELRQPSGGYVFPPNVRVYGPEFGSPRTVFDWLPRKLGIALHDRWLRRSWRGPASSILLQSYYPVRKLLSQQTFDLVIFEHLASLLVSPLVARLAPKAVRVLDAHNIDHKLMDRAADLAGYSRVRCQETSLADLVHAFFACSEADTKELEMLNHKRLLGFTVPNGVDISRRRFDESPNKATSKEILFCGSLDYEPNERGLVWFHSQIWPVIGAKEPAARLLVIGRNSDSAAYNPLKSDPSVNFIGTVEDVVPYYRRAGIAIAPLLSGSGTRLKILEAMSLGNPVVSTRIGAEGIAAEDEENILLADKPQEFAAAVLRLIASRDAFDNLRRAGRHLVEEKYDWRVVGNLLNNVVNTLIRQDRHSVNHTNP